MAAGDPLRQPDEDAGSEASQRARLVAAFGRAAAEHGYAELSVEQVLRYAGLPRVTYEEHFESTEQALIAAQEEFFARLWQEVRAACAGPEEWPFRVRAGLEAALALVVEVSGLARLFAVEAVGASAAAAERQLAALERYAELLRDGRRRFPRAAELPEITEQAVIGGVSSIVSGHLLMEEPQAIPARQPELVELLLMPYVGVAEARRVATA